MKKRIFTVLLALSLALTVLAIPAYAANTPAISNNVAWWGNHDYTWGFYAMPVRSHLVAENNGYTRVEHVLKGATEDRGITIDRYDQNLKFLSHSELKLELPLYGGIYFGTNYNFLVCGQENKEENNDKEVIRVIRYSKDWQRQAAASLYGANTTVPFRAGSLDMVESGNMLYIRTCHEMYRDPSDGLNHQANIQLSVRIPDMTITEQQTGVSNYSTGYVSHSFNQMILKDGPHILAADHGDAYPRSVIMFRYDHSAGAEHLAEEPAHVEVFPIVGETGDNYTGVSVGGLQSSDTAYLIAGNSVQQKVGTDLRKGQRNIFVTVTPKGAFSEDATQVKWLTDYHEGDNVAVTTPFLVKITGNSFMMLWEENDKVRYALLDGNGNLVSKIYQAEGKLSGCEPIVANGKITWYFTGDGTFIGDSTPFFYQISCSDPENFQFVHEHEYVTEVQTYPTWDSTGTYIKTCKGCGDIKTGTMPALNDEDYTITENVPPTCKEHGYVVFYWKQAGFENITLSQSFAPLYHDYEDIITNPTCMNDGYITCTCKRCGDSYTSAILPATGHSFGAWTVTQAPTNTTEGVESRTCTACGQKETRQIPALGNPFTDVCTDDYYYTPVLWAVNKGVTAGISADRFGPGNICTRGQIVTFLWSAAGKPEPKSTNNPFADVDPADYYYKAVLWAVENGITSGVSADRFAPGQTCTRGQTVTFLWASKGKPTVSSGTSFNDVVSTDYYYNAVQWAVANEVTAGVGSGRFGPNQDCTRGQIVTFLYKAMN